MWISKKEYQKLEKRVANLEAQVQSQQIDFPIDLDVAKIAKFITTINDFQRKTPIVTLQI